MIKGLLKMIVVGNILFTPVYFMFFFDLAKKKNNINDYELEEVKITNMYYGSDASDSKTEVVIDYKTIKDFNKMGNIHFTTESESYSHFGKGCNMGGF